jgi:serine/threonine protein kinase
MIEEDNNVRLIDFGISKIASKTITFTGNQTGTIPYMSPEYFDVRIDEQTNKPIPISPKVDIWATGCLISEIFSGKTPWSNKCRNEYAITKKLTMGGEFPIPENIDDNIKEIIIKCTKNDANERCTANDIKNDIAVILKSD